MTQADAFETRGIATYRTEFPDFDPATMPALPAHFEDHSWNQDTCPIFSSEWCGVNVGIDYADKTLREYEDGTRFFASHVCGEEINTDNWNDVLAFIAQFDY